jgi:RHH-type transcriptional regulator, proline utilization regulon repressor / proline dehydrogenase / delta 1-pyrroline-5-carboxylate dehydrogenase
VIDKEAFDNIQRHLQRLNGEGKSLLQIPVDPALASEQPHMITPQMFEVKDIAEVKAEIFGPVLQVVRWKGDPAQLIERINALNYGLTMGIQTRIDSRAQALAARAPRPVAHTICSALCTKHKLSPPRRNCMAMARV